MGRKRKQRRQPHGSAWHWKQTDCWYYTMPGTKKRVPLFHEDGQRIRGIENKEAAELALAREKLSWDEKALYGATEECFRNFLFAAIHTGLRPFCDLAKLTADDVEETDRGMMWRVYSTKTKKTRKILVRPEVAELTRKLTKTAPKGSGVPLFRNTKGRPWKRMTGVVRFIAIKEKLGCEMAPV